MATTEPTVDSITGCMTTDVLCVRADDAVPDAVRRLVEMGVDGAPVLDDDGNLVGMLSASDVMVQGARLHLPTVFTLFGMSAELPGEAARYDRDLERALASKVADLMTRDPRTIDVGASVADAATIMHDEEVSRLPVLDESGRVVGIVARGDVLRYLIGDSGSDKSNSSR